MNWENRWGKKGWDLWKIEVGLQKLRRKPKFFRPYLNYPKVKAFFSSSVFPIRQQRKNFCLVMDPFSAFFWRKPVNLSWDWYPFNLSLTCTANSAVVDSMFHQRYHKCQIDPTSVSILAFLKIIWPNFIFCANTLHKNNKQIHLISGSQGVKTKICKLSFNSFFFENLVQKSNFDIHH